MAKKPGKRRRRLGRALRVVARAVADKVPFTPLGFLLLGGATAATVHFGYYKMDLVVLAMGLAAMGVGVVCLLVVVTVSIVLKTTFNGGRAEGLAVECGTPTRTGFSFSTLWYVPLAVVRWRWLEPQAQVTVERRRGRALEAALIQRRGVYERIVRRVEITDPFRLTKIAIHLAEPRKVRALPSVGMLKQMTVIRAMASGEDHPDPTGVAGGDRMDIRNYVSGDPIRYILWRVFAKSRQMVVRTPERSLSIARKAYAYLVTGDGDEPAAGAARVAIESGVLGSDWVFGADGVDEYADRRVQALELVARSARATEEQSGAGLARFLTRHAAGGGRILVFVPARPGPWLQRVASSAGRHVEFLVCTDGVVPRPKKSLVKRVATVDERETLVKEPDADEVAEAGWMTADAAGAETVLSTLAKTRSRVVLADRKTGRVYEGGVLPKLTDIAPPSKAKPRAAAQAGG